MPGLARDPCLGSVVVEEKSILVPAEEIKPGALLVAVQEGVNLLVRPEPPKSLLPEPQTGRRTLHGKDPA